MLEVGIFSSSALLRREMRQGFPLAAPCSYHYSMVMEQSFQDHGIMKTIRRIDQNI